MKILITGNKGFIGSELSKRLEEKNHKIFGIDTKANSNIFTAELPEVDLVIHLAAIGGVRESLADPKKYWSVNVEGTKRIIEHYQNTRVLYAGSSSQYEPHLNPYAASKNAIEYIPHPNSVVMRFHTVYSDTPRFNMFFDKLLNGKLEYVTNHKRDFLHIEDLCDAILTIIDNPFFKGPVDIGTGQSVRIRDIAPNLPVKEITLGERLETLADISKMKQLGWSPKWTVQKFLTQQGFDVKL